MTICNQTKREFWRKLNWNLPQKNQMIYLQSYYHQNYKLIIHEMLHIAWGGWECIEDGFFPSNNQDICIEQIKSYFNGNELPKFVNRPKLVIL